jgi:uncharacterized protein (DUF1778 family)
MRTSSGTSDHGTGKTASPLMVRLDAEGKQCLAEAAAMRQVSVSDYVRTVTVAQARREVRASREQMVVLRAEEQLVFWKALNEPPRLTAAQRRLGMAMRAKR